ncbi:MAG: LysM peptidoglycan-binding domain-containing protein, partial [Chloroflexota bacterium]
PDFENLTPEYYEAVRSDRVRSGGNAQRYESFFATHEGGVFQIVENVGNGEEITFTAHVYVWSSALDDEDDSANDGDVLVQVGIDPTGGTNGESDDILWSQFVEQYDEYVEHTVSAISESGTVSVWIKSRVGFPVKTSRVYLDDASLVIEGGSTSPVPTEPTEAPTTAPTATPVDVAANPTPTPDTAIVTPPPTSTPITTGGGTGGPTGGNTGAPITSEFPNTLVHTVQSGNTVSGLADTYQSTVAAIRNANGLNANSLIFVGQQLVIPVASLPATPVPTQGPEVIIVTATPSGGVGGPAPAGDVYVVRPGDTLSSISRTYNTTVAALAQLNGIVNANTILVGQQLQVPSGASGGPAQPTAPSDTPAQTYVVQPGDNLYRIALRFSVSLAELIDINGVVDANRIFVGQRLTLP